MSECLIYSAPAGAPEPNYTRLLRTHPEGPHRGALFLVFDDGLPAQAGLPVFPVHRSTDGGLTWRKIGQVADTAYGLGHRYQPAMLELETPVGAFDAGTLLLSGNAIPGDLSQTRLPLYASRDGGASWTYLSEIDAGGPAIYDPSPESTTTAVWEPELRQIGPTLFCFYSDERYKSRGMLQTLVSRATPNLLTWGPKALVFGVPDRRTRPGMLVTTPHLPTGDMFGVLEIVGGPGVPVQLVHSPNGLDWGQTTSLGHQIISTDGTSLSGSPTISYTRMDGTDLLLATGRTALDVTGRAVNRALQGTVSQDSVVWTDIDLPVLAQPTLEHEMAGYSQSLLLLDPDPTLVHATSRRNGAGNLDVIVGTKRLEPPNPRP